MRIKEELKKEPKDTQLQKRLSSLTNGVVTIKVSGKTAVEVREKIFRYEDAINATRSAMKHGYVVGGGLSFINAYNPKDHKDIGNIARKFSQVITRQIAENCGKHPDSVIENTKGNIGYNALTNKFEDLVKVGVIDPYMVSKTSIENAVSIANTINSINYFIINDKREQSSDGNIKGDKGK